VAWHPSEHRAREALGMASSPECQIRWGAAEAAELLGRALIAQDLLVEGAAALTAAQSLRM
jgi:hypothetical protein